MTAPKSGMAPRAEMVQDALPVFNDVLRDTVLDAVSELSPEGLPVGGVLSLIIGLFWPESDKSEETWNSIRVYAEKLVKDAIDTERTETLSKRIEGFKNVARDYRDTSMESPQKGQYLTSMLTTLDLFEPDFWDERNPEKMFPLFTSFGTLWVFALAEQALYYKEIYHQEDPDAAKHLQRLRENITKYSDAAQTMFDRLYTWRFSLLQIKEWQWIDVYSSSSEWTFVDRYDGFSKSSGIAGDYGHNFHNPGGRQLIEQIAADHVAQINGGFIGSLQATMEIARLWHYVDPVVPRPLKSYVVSSEGPFGGISGRNVVDQPSASSKITRINVRHGAIVDCLEVFYDGQSTGPRGNPKGGELSDLQLAEDEYVVEVSGRSGIFIDAIQFTTNKQRKVGGGWSMGGEPFVAQGHGWENTSLFALSSRNDDYRLTSLTCHWKHLAQLPPYVLTYKRNGVEIRASANVQLKAKDGSYISRLVKEYSGKAAAYEYFPKSGSSPVSLQLRLPAAPIGSPGGLSDYQVVHIWTSEKEAEEYQYLGKYSSPNVYYYSYSPGDRRQLWEVIKMIPSDGPVLVGEQVYLRNLDGCNYLCPAAGRYLATNWEPYAWDIVPVT